MGDKDHWAEWLAHRRYGDDAEQRRRGLEELTRWRDRVLDNAKLAKGETVLDVGCGEGLIGFGAFERGADMVVFSDISEELLDFCREAATDLGLVDRCRFIQASADDLASLEVCSIDVLTTRSVLIYVEDKASAFSEFSRVLRPGGRISLFEPINRFSRRRADTWAGYDLGAVPDIAQKIRAVYDAIQSFDSDPMLNFDERDLIDFAEQAGFFPIHLDLQAALTAIAPRSWEAFSVAQATLVSPPLPRRCSRLSRQRNKNASSGIFDLSSSKAQASGGWRPPILTPSSLKRRGRVEGCPSLWWRQTDAVPRGRPRRPSRHKGRGVASYFMSMGSA